MSEPRETTSTPAGERPPRPGSPRRTVALLVGLGIVALGGLAAALVNLQPNLSHLEVTILSGDPQGNYHHVVERLGAAAAERLGTVHNVATKGSLENVERLVEQAESSTARFALVQDGLEWSAEQKESLALLARLDVNETVFFLALDAGRLKGFADLAGMRIGIGPERSGTARLARQIFASRGFDQLKPKLSHHSLPEQLDLLESKELDLAVFVIAPDAKLIDGAVRARGLQIVSFPRVEVVARRLPSLEAGVIQAGHYDPIRVLPPVDKHVLQVETLVLGDRSASRSQTVGLLVLLSETFPGFIKHNRSRPNTTGLREDREAEAFFQEGGAAMLDEYTPWLVDIIPLSNMVTVVLVVSILFNLMGAGHRFFLWRVDVNRVDLEEEQKKMFGSRTVEEIETLEPDEALRARRTEVEALLHGYERLQERCRKLSVSVLVPMGKELAYRYQESLIEKRLTSLRAVLDRI